MLKISLLAFAVAAALGLTMAVRHFTQKGIPLGLALVHGLFAASGLALLIVGGIRASFPAHTELAAGLFVLTALGGFTMFGMEFAKRPLPSALVLIHGSAAVVSFLIQLTSVMAA